MDMFQNNSPQKKKLRGRVSYSDLMRTHQVPVTIHSLHIEGTHENNEKSIISGSVMSVSSESTNSPFVKPVRALQIDMELASNCKWSFTLGDEKGKLVGRFKKVQNVATETSVCNDVEMPIVEIVDRPCVVEMNPLKIEMILGTILSNLGKHDLLNARMVSRIWNNESLKILRKSKFTQMLRYGAIKEYILLSTSVSKAPRPFIIPFHLNFFISLSLHLTQYSNRILSHVDSLCQIFGLQCVSTLTLFTCDTDCTEKNIKDIGLIEFFTLISPGLKTLDLTRLRLRIDFLKNQNISFPILKKLICNTSQCESGRISGPGLTYIYIIENSPNLEDLTLTHPRDLDSWPLNFNQLKSLSLDSMFKPQSILNKILSSSGPPVLRVLSIGLRYREWSPEDEIVVHNILKSVSSTLKSLIFRGYMFALRKGNPTFPKLPQLEHLGLEYDRGNTTRLDAENVDISQEKFPSLKSIELPIGYIFIPSASAQSEVDHVKIDFPNLIKLTLRVSATAGHKRVRVDGPLEHLQQIFPTPSKLCLLNVGGRGFVKYVLYRIMKSNWSESIQQIELIGFSQNDLGGILEGLEFSSGGNLEKWYEKLEESLKTEFQNTMKRIRMEFEMTENDDGPGSFILRRVKQSDCPIKK